MSKRCPLFTRWCRQVCTVQVGKTAIPLKVSTKSGDEVDVEACPTSILWPWDILHWMWKKGTFFGWVADEQNTASARCEDYWNHCTHLDFYARLQLEANQHRTTVPVFFHADGVRIYKAQKAWIYSFSSACRKGPSTKTKIVLLVIRENRVIKDKTHDAIGKLMGYITSTMQSGQFPDRQPDGSPFAEGSLEASRIGTFFCGGWTLAFAAFKGDWEARVVIHKHKRFYNSTWICEHCMASRDPRFTFGDFRMSAQCLQHRFTHEEYMILQGDRQSSWRCVKGWTKDRNLEDL